MNGDRRIRARSRHLRRLLHLLEGARFDLAHTLARDGELGRKLLQRRRLLRQTARFEDAPLALGEHRERFAQGLPAALPLLAVGETGFLVRTLVGYPVLPLV